MLDIIEEMMDFVTLAVVWMKFWSQEFVNVWSVITGLTVCAENVQQTHIKSMVIVIVLLVDNQWQEIHAQKRLVLTQIWLETLKQIIANANRVINGYMVHAKLLLSVLQMLIGMVLSACAIMVS